jgi:hypothetical protein
MRQLADLKHRVVVIFWLALLLPHLVGAVPRTSLRSLYWLAKGGEHAQSQRAEIRGKLRKGG